MLHLLPVTPLHCSLLSPVCERNLGIWDTVLPEAWLGEQGGLASLQTPASSLLPRGWITSGDSTIPCFASLAPCPLLPALSSRPCDGLAR